MYNETEKLKLQRLQEDIRWHPKSRVMVEKEPTSIDEVIDSINVGKPQILLALIFLLLHGTEVGNIVAVILQGTVLQCHWGISSFLSALLVSVTFIGMLPGDTVWGMVADRVGRRDLLVVLNLTMFLTAFLIALCPTISWMIFLRVIIGFLTGGSFSISAAILPELLPQRVRSKSVVGMFIGTSIGLLYVNLLFFFLYPSLGWRWVTFFIALPTLVISFVVFLYVPRSPRYLLLTGQYNKVIASLRFLTGQKDFDVDVQIMSAHRIEKRGNLMDVFSEQHRVTTALLTVVFFGVSFCHIGMLTTVVYLPLLSNRCSSDGSHIEVLDDSCCPFVGASTFANAALASIGPILCTVANMFLIDVIGRKKSMMLWSAVALVAILCLNFCQPLATLRLLMALTTGALEALFSCAYVYSGEYYPTSIRASGFGVCSSVGRIGHMIGVYPAEMLLSTIGTVLVLFLYAIVMVMVFAAAILLPVETMGRKLAQTSNESKELHYHTFSEKGQ